MHSHLAANRRQSGVTLLEVLIAIIVFSVAVLGLARLQVFSLQNSLSTYQASHLTVAAGAILDAMRADRDHALAGGYNLSFGQSSADFASDDSFSGMALRSWLAELETILPGLFADDQRGARIMVQDGIATIRIRWHDERWMDSGESDSLRTLELESRI